MGQDVAIKRQHFGFYSEREILHAVLNCKTLLWVLCINFSLVIWNNLDLTEKNSFEATGSSFLVLLNFYFGEWQLFTEKHNQVNEQQCIFNRVNFVLALCTLLKLLESTDCFVILCARVNLYRLAGIALYYCWCTCACVKALNPRNKLF